jgi:hypothetical protein
VASANITQKLFIKSLRVRDRNQMRRVCALLSESDAGM